MPGLAVLAAAAQVGHRVHAALFDKGPYRCDEAWCDVHVETAVAVQQGGRATVAYQSLARHQKHGNQGAVFRRIAHLLDREGICIDG